VYSEIRKSGGERGGRGKEGRGGGGVARPGGKVKGIERHVGARIDCGAMCGGRLLGGGPARLDQREFDSDSLITQLRGGHSSHNCCEV